MEHPEIPEHKLESFNELMEITRQEYPDVPYALLYMAVASHIQNPDYDD
jgi:hypothetical protein